MGTEKFCHCGRSVAECPFTVEWPMRDDLCTVQKSSTETQPEARSYKIEDYLALLRRQNLAA